MLQLGGRAERELGSKALCCGYSNLYALQQTQPRDATTAPNLYCMVTIEWWRCLQVYKIHDQLFLGLAGLGTDTQTLCVPSPMPDAACTRLLSS